MKKISYHTLKKDLDRLKKTYFTVCELKKFYKNKKTSLKNLLSRWTREKLIFPLGNGCYCFDTGRLDYMNLACNLVRPSYISFEYALSFYGLSDRISWIITLTTLKRHKFVHAGPYAFEYTKLKKELFFGYERIDDYYIASPEKALLDTIYLVSKNKRLVDLKSLNLEKINKKKLYDLAKRFPEYVRKELKSVVGG